MLKVTQLEKCQSEDPDADLSGSQTRALSTHPVAKLPFSWTNPALSTWRVLGAEGTSQAFTKRKESCEGADRGHSGGEEDGIKGAGMWPGDFQMFKRVCWLCHFYIIKATLLSFI